MVFARDSKVEKTLEKLLFFCETVPKCILEQCINEGCNGWGLLLCQDYKAAEQDEDNDNRSHPVHLLLLDKLPEILHEV